MFASFSRVRRHVAVLTALAMMASVLVAAPAVAADPKADYKATFDACVGVGSADFEDVPANHANMGDIDCIAYYGITKGTGDGTTYSPLMSVTREHMALFLVRLAGRVGIAVASDPSDPGFTDTGDLSAESQTAIAQLADLGITKGTSVNIYSPGDNVSRAHMALFIARLMDKITPAADGEVGLSSTTQHGYTPANVAKNAKEADIGSPFTDLGQATKDEYDAITHLYELGVASGISATSYSPSSDMTRAAMAEFMAAVMDHSNLRPAGLSIQASPTTSWGAGSPTVVVSVRDDMFMAVDDQAVDVFSSAAENNGLRNDGTCNFATNDDVLRGSIDGDCVWNDNDDATDADGNLFTSGDVAEGTTRVFYAWIGSKNGDKFDADTADEATVSVSAKAAQASLKASSSINKKADTTYDGDGDGTVEVNAEDQLGAKVDLRAVSSVTFSAQLKDSDGANVARSGVSVRVEYKQDDSYQNTHEATLTTDDAGMVSFPVNGPSNGKGDDSRADEVIFTELDANGAKTMRTDTGKVYWVEETPVITDSALEVADYLMDGSSISVGARVRLYDQYGNPHRPWSGQTADITIGTSTATGGADANNFATRDVISRGYARWSRSVTHDDDIGASDTVNVSYELIAHKRNSAGILLDANDDIIDSDGDTANGVQGTTEQTDTDVTGSLVVIYQADGTTDQSTSARAKEVPVVRPANSQDDVGVAVTHVLGNNTFLAAPDADGTTVTDIAAVNPTFAYSYDSDDIFINSEVTDGTTISMDKFTSTIDNSPDGLKNMNTPVVKITVLVYNADGSSVFEITSTD